MPDDTGSSDAMMLAGAAGDARSPAGHAAFSMRGTDDRWVVIQLNTFRNWVSEQLRRSNCQIEDLQMDFSDGTKLCLLVEALQGKSVGRYVSRPMNQLQALENCTIALSAITRDNIKLVNIGSVDIVNGNLKLILALVWHLILRYQIGRSKVPPKKLMLAWLNAVLPGLRITNFNTNWNDGIALHALIEYCRPGTCPNWKQLKRSEGLQNCRSAMRLAKQHFNIPLVLSPENLSNPELDELSGMTYLSYFMKVDSPGYNATLCWVQQQIPEQKVKNFQKDWNDGKALAVLVKSLGRQVDKNGTDKVDPMTTTKKGMEVGKALGVEPVISAKEMIDPEVDHLGIMAYVALFQHAVPQAKQKQVPSRAPPVARQPSTPVTTSPRIPPGEMLELRAPVRQTRVNNPVSFIVEPLQEGVDKDDILVEAVGVKNKAPVTVSWKGGKGHGKFTPTEPGLYKIFVYHHGKVIQGAPANITVKVDPSSVKVVDPPTTCPARRSTPVKISAEDARSGNVKVESRSPSGITQDMSVVESNGIYTANFTPTEVGDWLISIMYDRQHIEGSPFHVRVYDAEQVKVHGLENGAAGKLFSFTVDTLRAGEGDLTVDVTNNGRQIPVQLHPEGRGTYRVTYTPSGGGVYTIHVHFSGMEVQGSPFTVEIIDASSVVASGDGLGMVEVNQRASFVINTGDNARTGGELKVNITSPRGALVPCDVYNQGNGSFRVEYVVSEVGEYRIEVLYHGSAIMGSPFRVHSSDWSRITVRNLRQTGLVGHMVGFDIDTSNAGSGNLEIMVNDGTIPCSVQNRGNRQFHASFMPKETIPHIIQMRFNGRNVPNSPFTVDIRSLTNVTVSGPGLQLITVNTLAYFDVRTGDRNIKDVSAVITSPSSRPVSNHVIDNNNGSFRVEFTPTEVGTFNIEVLCEGSPINGSPFSCKTFDSSAIVVSSVPSGMVGKPVEFKVDVTRAGEGQLEIMVNRGSVPNTVKMLQKGIFLVSFTPRDSQPHYVNIKFNSEQLPSCPITVPILDTSRVTVQGEGLHQVAVNRQSYFHVSTQSAGEADLAVRVTGPTNCVVPVKVTGTASNGFDVEYTPTEAGVHRIEVEYANQLISGSPFTVKAYDVGSINVEKITDGVVGRRSSFFVNTDNAGEGNMEITIEAGGRKIQNHVRQIGQGRFEVSFTPMDACEHQVSVTFNAETIPGSPFVLGITDASKVSARGDGLSLVPCHRPSLFNISAPGARMRDLDVKVTAPNGELVPAKIVMQPDEDYKVEYSSKYTGRHMVEILYAGQAIMGSPFYVEIYDPNKIRIEGGRTGSVGQPIDFEIIRSEAGKAELGVTITNPTGTNITYEITPTPKGDRVTYTPSIPGPYQIYITYGGLDVPGCPITQNVTEASLATAYGDGLYKAGEHKNTSFFVDTKGQPGDLFIQIDGPNSMAKYKVDQDASGRYLVTYVPVEVGQYDVTIKWNGYEIEGSPFHPKVMNPSNVAPIGGWEQLLSAQGKVSLTANQTRRIDFDTSLSGEGQLTAEVRGPGGIVPVTVEGFGGQRSVTFTPQGEGDYYITLWWNEVQLPRCPIVATTHTGGYYNSSSTMATMQQTGGMVEQQQQYQQQYQPPVVVDTMVKQQQVQQVVTTSQVSSVNHEKVVLMGRGLTGAQVHEEAEFVIDGTDAGPGVPSVKLTGVTTDIDIQVTPVGVNKYRCTYVPIMPGAYLLSITWSDRQVRGSPFKVSICASSDASKVDCTGNGLKMGIMGREIKSTIDARQAGPGELTAHCTGPTKVAFCQLFDHHDGTFTLNIKPQEPGRHVLQVKYGGEHVPGSPFELKVSGAPDASKVKVTGPGVEHGILATFRSHFICETRGAGAGQLTVRVRGPKGAFRVEMQRESQRDRTILCRYDPTEVGEYAVHVRWSDKDVPGSPFNIRIFDTKEELDRALATLRHRRPDNTNMTMASMTWHDDEM